jgi:hypothetical protein
MNALASLGPLNVVDYHRIEGESTEWVIGHVRANLDVVEKGIILLASEESGN